MAVKVLKGCGVLRVDNDTILLDDTTNVISVDPTRLITDAVAWISIPATFATLSVAQTISERLRDAMISAGIMEEEA